KCCVVYINHQNIILKYGMRGHFRYKALTNSSVWPNLKPTLPRFEITCESEKLVKDVPGSGFFFAATCEVLCRVCSSALSLFLMLLRALVVLIGSAVGGAGVGTTSGAGPPPPSNEERAEVGWR